MSAPITPELIEAARAARDAELAELAYEPWFHLASTAGTTAHWLADDAAYLRGRRDLGRSPDVSDIRGRIEDLGRALAAYDAAIASGKTKVTNAEWNKCCKRGRPS